MNGEHVYNRIVIQASQAVSFLPLLMYTDALEEVFGNKCLDISYLMQAVWSLFKHFAKS